MKLVYLMMHQSKPNMKKLARQVMEPFQSAGIDVILEPWLAERLGETTLSIGSEQIDAIISVGGDGTLLRANQFAAETGIPLLGINMGRIGFLSELEFEQLPEACQKLKTGEYQTENRMLLNASCEQEMSFLALNDVVISRGGYARLIAIKVWVDHELVGRYIADGMIISTPTGSTGYSLSAGGPIVFPGVDCVILSPICAHSLQHRPVVISSRQTVVLELDCDSRQKAQLSVDGQVAMHLSAQRRVTITRSDKTARFIRFDTQEFFGIIRQKLTEWSC